MFLTHKRCQRDQSGVNCGLPIRVYVLGVSRDLTLLTDSANRGKLAYDIGIWTSKI
jgi:hypothetical protein